MGKRAELAAALLLAWAASACNGCEGEKPYTPFGVTSALPPALSAPAPLASTPTSSDAGRYQGAVVAPAGSRKLRMKELTLEAPPRYVFDRALTLGEGAALQAVAWVKAEPEAHDIPQGVLIAFSASGETRQLLTLPSFVPIAPGCSYETRLEQTAAGSVLVDTRATCTTPLVARVPVEAISVVAPASSHPEVLTLRLAAPAPGEALSVAEDSSDRDADGREDVRLTLTLTAPDGAKASASLVFLDRAAGVSRDASEPVASLLAAAKAALGKPGPSTLGEIAAQRRLLASLCAEGATPRVFDAEGAPLRCGELGAIVDTLARAEVLARLAAKDVLGAFSVLTRADWYFKKLSADAQKSISKELTKRLLAITPTASALVARPKQPKGPHFSPLWFETDGSLLVVTDAGVVRASRDGATESPLDAEAGVPSWPLDVTGASGKRLTGSLCACDASEVQLGVTDASGALLPGLPTKLLAPRPGGCRGRFSCPDPSPISVATDGFAVLLAGSVVETAPAGSALPSPGSARSPDGKWLVAVSPLGLVVSGPTPELWKLPDAPVDARRAQDCVVANDRSAVACVAGDKAVLLKRP